MVSAKRCSLLPDKIEALIMIKDNKNKGLKEVNDEIEEENVPDLADIVMTEDSEVGLDVAEGSEVFDEIDVNEDLMEDESDDSEEDF